MFNRISSVILTILLFLLSWWSISGQNPASLMVFVLSLAVFAAAVLVVNSRRVGFVWPHLLLPILFLAGFGSLFAVITGPGFREVFLIAASLTFYAMEVQLGKESHFLQNVYLFSAFAIFVGLFAVQFYFNFNFVLLGLGVFVATYLLIIQGFAGFSLPVKKYFSFLTALVCAEASLGLYLWPTYYVVDAIVVFAIFYLLWIFSFSAFFGKLTRNKILWQLGFVCLVLLAVLATTSFRPLTGIK
ncbi:MAG TPA: hypothetical protein VFX17_03950 [Patescibacteria group bacterium]|nr:hypothetical protein [Patescibacteria group bacterium]